MPRSFTVLVFSKVILTHFLPFDNRGRKKTLVALRGCPLSLASRDSSPKGGAKTCGGTSPPAAAGTSPFRGGRGVGRGFRVSSPRRLPLAPPLGELSRVSETERATPPQRIPLSPLKGEMSPQRQRGCSGGAICPNPPTSSVAAPPRRARVLPLPNPRTRKRQGQSPCPTVVA
jgi:hypothetical protein